MDTALPQKFPFILDRNLAKANCTENRVCTSCDTVVLGLWQKHISCPNESTFLGIGHDWYFMCFSLFKFQHGKIIPEVRKRSFRDLGFIYLFNFFFLMEKAVHTSTERDCLSLCLEKAPKPEIIE